jgi:hypothetical protein
MEGKPAVRLEWQSEFDSAMADLDSRLRHPRRRASDVGPQPTLSDLGQFDVTKELLDEISWRVAEQLRRAPAGTVPEPAPLAAPAAPPAPAIPEGAALVIRLRRPLFRWPFKRRSKQQAMISLSDYRIT